MAKKEDFICTLPFTYAAVFSDYVDICCDMWHTAGHVEEKSIEDAWNSKKLREFRNSILDGSYRFCSVKCPHLNTLLTEGKSWCFVERTNTNLEAFKNPTLKHVKLCDNESCNLRCITCRSDFKKGNALVTLNHLDELKQLGVERVDILGSGEPLAIAPVKHWLRNFTCEEYPDLKQIHIHSNGQLFSQEMYDSFSSDAKKLFKTVEISIDAASKSTYEKIRRGGQWERLMDNLKFLLSLDLKEYHFSFVVQKENYQEVERFYDLIQELSQKQRNTSLVTIRYTYAECWISESEYECNVKLPKEFNSLVVEQIEKVVKKGSEDSILIYHNIVRDE